MIVYLPFTVSNGMWHFNGKEVTEDEISGFEGFVYLITNKVDGRKYIGKKFLHSIRKQKGKSRRVKKESDWREYWSSSEILKEDISKVGSDNFIREILVLCKTRGDTNRMETFYLWKHDVLDNPLYYNETIGNFRKTSDKIRDGRKFSEDGLKMKSNPS